MWPALWFFAASGSQRNIDAAGFQGAEIDIVECEGNFMGNVSFHMRENDPPQYDIANPIYSVNGSSDINVAYAYPMTINHWDTCGMDWQTDAITFYKNGVEMYKQTNATILSYYNQVHMNAKLDYTVISGTDSGPNSMTMSVDYIRQWPDFAASRAIS
jgi:hypothetical protein